MEQPGANIPPIKVYPDKFQGQIVLVTGAGQGIGEVTARLFASQGASVVLVDMNEQTMQEVAKSIQSRGGQATCRVCNLGVESEVDLLIAEVISTQGKIDVLVHLAGIYPFKPLLESTSAEYYKVMNVNTDSCFFLTRAILPHMEKAGYGRIVNTVSGAMLRPEPGLAMYIGAKSAVAGLTRAAAGEAGVGVTVNAVCPGLIRTERTWTSGVQPDGAHPLFDKMVGEQRVKRHGLPRDVAHTICFIASPEAEFITGQMFDVGGGATMH